MGGSWCGLQSVWTKKAGRAQTHAPYAALRISRSRSLLSDDFSLLCEEVVGALSAHKIHHIPVTRAEGGQAVR